MPFFSFTYFYILRIYFLCFYVLCDTCVVYCCGFDIPSRHEIINEVLMLGLTVKP